MWQRQMGTAKSWTVRFACAFAVVWTCGCGVGSRTRGYPLRGVENETPNQVARLHGYVQLVDDEDVSGYGHLFELLPGCHVIVTPTTFGGAGTDAWATAETGHLRFVIRMRAGHDYEVRVSVLEAVNRVEIETIEKDPQREVVAKHLPVADPDARCP